MTFYRIGVHTKKISNTENLINELSSCTGTDKEVYVTTDSIKISKIVDHVYILSRDVSKLEIVNDHIINNGADCTIVPMDLTKKNNIKELAKNIYEKKNKILTFMAIIAVLSFALEKTGLIHP